MSIGVLDKVGKAVDAKLNVRIQKSISSLVPSKTCIFSMSCYYRG
jgi:hypothetical protein